MTPSEIWQFGLTIASILYGIHNQIRIHRIHKELKERRTETYVVRITIDKTGVEDPIVTSYKVPDDPKRL